MTTTPLAGPDSSPGPASGRASARRRRVFVCSTSARASLPVRQLAELQRHGLFAPLRRTAILTEVPGASSAILRARSRESSILSPFTSTMTSPALMSALAAGPSSATRRPSRPWPCSCRWSPRCPRHILDVDAEPAAVTRRAPSAAPTTSLTVSAAWRKRCRHCHRTARR